MSTFLRSFLVVVWFGLAAVLIAGLLLWVSSLLRPSKPTREKMLTYESGVDPVGEGWSQSQVRYYIFALLFVIFDVEAVFIFPWATQLERYGMFGLVEMGIFVFVLLLGLVYAWRKRVLRWVQQHGSCRSRQIAKAIEFAIQHGSVLFIVGVPVGTRMLRN
jgi:NADH-quinone oxidoreductase subunit A